MSTPDSPNGRPTASTEEIQLLRDQIARLQSRIEKLEAEVHQDHKILAQDHEILEKLGSKKLPTAADVISPVGL